ncbi:MAG: peptidylprolyl isomerase [Acidobacteria bacterium]|nr:peptidylprolyl isomerase [Acidobacteriota bacterium]
MRRILVVVATVAVWAALVSTPVSGQVRRVPAASPPAKPVPLFTTPMTLAQMTGKQAVLETTAGRIVIALLPEQAPNHVGYFIRLAQDGAYNGTTFHRLIKHGIIQGGDPLSKDPAKKAQYGTGGLKMLAFEPGAGAHGRGAVSAVLVPGNRDSAGSQFFICVTPQPALDGQFTVFGQVVEGIAVVTQISEAPVDEAGRAVDRVEITSVTIREAPPAGVEPFSTDGPAELARYRAVLETSLGNITVEFFPDKAPNHVRNFLRLASVGVYSGMTFHRVVPGFMVQTGYLGSRQAVLDDAQQQHIRNLQPEFNDIPHDKGIVSMARGDDPASANTSFFIVTARTPAIDGKYTVFGKVVDGMSVVEAIEQAPRDGEAPRTKIDLVRVRVEKQ